ncbi:MAG: AAA family ATPase, partial [Oscillospiraceae bacterium]|nr:AAA family ATPase [Oscillospiraceae bacterium]
MYKPLADEIRPANLDEVVGQGHILGEDGMLRRIIESGQIPNMIFYGPSGTGKTTVARIIAERTNRTLRKLNATTAGIADIKAIIDELDTFLTPGGVLLYLDEIQYFNKKQQQSLLEFIEDGRITLIASTTENPYFCVFKAILSRSTVFEFKVVSPEDVQRAVERAVNIMNSRRAEPLEIEEGVLPRLASSCGGDVRKAINAVELLFSTAVGRHSISLADALAISQRSSMRYDRDGDEHFDSLSALMKSLRGSDPDAAMHYLARLLEAGDLVQVPTGEKIPADGVVFEGKGSTNEAMLTGESLPRSVDVGDEVFSATLLEDGLLTVRITKTGEETALRRIAALLEETAASKAPAARLAD